MHARGLLGAAVDDELLERELRATQLAKWLSELVRGADALRRLVADAFAAPLPLPNTPGAPALLKSSRFSLVERLEKSERRLQLDEGESGFFFVGVRGLGGLRRVTPKTATFGVPRRLAEGFSGRRRAGVARRCSTRCLRFCVATICERSRHGGRHDLRAVRADLYDAVAREKSFNTSTRRPQARACWCFSGRPQSSPGLFGVCRM